MHFDPYHQWLGIRDLARPPSHYRLLGVDLFESDPDVILTAADRQMAHLRTFQHGQHVELSQQLLNEVAAAKVCLLDPDKKARYDAILRAALAPEAPPAMPLAPRPREATTPGTIIVPLDDDWAPRRPGRSARASRRRLRVVLVCLALAALPLAGYGLVRWQHNWQQAKTQPAATPSTAPTPPTPAAPGESDESSGAPTVQTPDGGTPPVAAEETPAPTAAEEPPPTPDPAETPAVPAPPVWEQANRQGARPEFSASDPLGSFFVALSRRDVAAAQTLLESLTRSKPAPDPIVLGQAQSLHFLMQRFWQAVDEGRQRLVQGQTITYRQVPLTVISVTDREIVLQTADGQHRLFDTRPQQIDRDLAIALVEQRFVAAVPAAWRMIGIFLAVDRDGDVSRAREYLQQAAQQGFPAQEVLELVERKPAAAAAPSLPSVVTTPGSAAAEGADAARLRSIPSRAAQEAVRRAVLSELREEFSDTATATDVAQRLLQKAASVQGDPVVYYVTLREALAKATTGRDLTTALAAIDSLAQSYQVDAWNARCILLQTLSRHVADDTDRHALITAAARLAGQAVAQHQFDAAGRLLDLALALVQPATEASLQERLQQVRDEVQQIGQSQATAAPSDQAMQLQRQLEEIAASAH